MPLYEYRCPVHGSFESLDRADVIEHDCGESGKRVWKLRIDAASARHQGRWDPQVGAYVESERQFRDLIRQGAERESAELNKDVKLELVDGRDQEAMAELHRQPLAERIEIKEKTDYERKKMAST